jgi:hypothetical protein
MGLGSTQPLTEISTRNFPGGKKRPARRAENLAAICEPNVCKLWEPQPLTTLRATTACTGIALPLPLHIGTLFLLENTALSWRAGFRDPMTRRAMLAGA